MCQLEHPIEPYGDGWYLMMIYIRVQFWMERFTYYDILFVSASDSKIYLTNNRKIVNYGFTLPAICKQYATKHN